MAGEYSSDVVVPFLAWHSSTSIRSVLGRWGMDQAALARPVRLPAPRAALYEAWNAFSFPDPGIFARSLRHADLVHSPTPAVPPVRRPLVVSVHDAGFALFPGSYTKRGLRFHTKAMQRVTERAGLVITSTRAARDEIVSCTPVPAERLRVVPLGIDHVQPGPGDVDRALARFDLAGAPYVLWVGSLEPRKNVGTLVRAFAEMVAADRSLSHRLVLVGPLGWLYEGIISGTDRAALGERLRPVGQVHETDLRCLYAGAAVFAFPSLHEGFGLPVLEAMAQGTPVVCSDLPVLREVAGEAALFVPPNDPEAWAAALSGLLLDQSACERLGAAGTAHAAPFSWERTARETHAVYEELLEVAR
jgi:glycosyltransferase involved in cell wall biosynthesis